MNMFIELTKRNIKLYLRDRSTVFVSLLSSFIILALFILFLGRLYINGTMSQFSPYGITDESAVHALVFSWVLAGIIVLNSISVPQMMLSRIILDKEKHTMDDFYVIPFNRSILGLSYIISAIVVGTMITYSSFLVGEIYIYSISGNLFNFSTHLYVLAAILLSTTSFSSLMLLIFNFIKKSSAIGGITAFTSSVGGFLAGIYITIGDLSGVVKDIVSSNPLAHATTLLRNILMNTQSETLFRDVPSEAVQAFNDSLALNLYVGAFQFNTMHYVISLISLGVVCFIVSYFSLRYDKI